MREKVLICRTNFEHERIITSLIVFNAENTCSTITYADLLQLFAISDIPEKIYINDVVIQ